MSDSNDLLERLGQWEDHWPAKEICLEAKKEIETLRSLAAGVLSIFPYRQSESTAMRRLSKHLYPWAYKNDAGSS